MEKDNIPIIEKLYPYQREHIKNLERCFDSQNVILDASDPGTGKTAVISALCALKNCDMFVIDPKSVTPQWFKFAEMFNVRVIGVSNYELIKTGKYYTSYQDAIEEKSKICPYIKPVKNNRTNPFEVTLPPCVVVIDEAHKGKNYRTQTSKLLACIKESFDTLKNAQQVANTTSNQRNQQGTKKLDDNKPDDNQANANAVYKIAILSGTIAETLDDFRVTAYILGIAQYGSHAYKVWKNQLLAAYPDKTPAEAIHSTIFPKYGARMNIKSIIDDEKSMKHERGNLEGSRLFRMYKWVLQEVSMTMSTQWIDVFSIILSTYNDLRSFKQSHISAKVYQMSPEAETEITAAWNDINQAIESIKNKQMGEIHPLTVILRARQRIEMLKVPTMVEIAMEFLMSNRAVIIFVNFTETIAELRRSLSSFVGEFGSCLTCVQGSQSMSERRQNIENFQNGNSICMLVNVHAGGTGTSFHHINPNALPRSTVISPPWSGIVLKQTLGRVNRAGSLSESEQVIVYCKGCVSSVAGNDTTFNNDAVNVNGAAPPQKLGIEELMAASINKKLLTIEYLNNGDIEDVIEI